MLSKKALDFQIKKTNINENVDILNTKFLGAPSSNVISTHSKPEYLSTTSTEIL